MGYDLHVRGIERPHFQSEDGEFNDEAYSPRYYLRRNIWGMSPLREALEITGAAFDDYEYTTGWAMVAGIKKQGPYPDFPNYPGDEHFEQVPMEGWTDAEGRPIMACGDPITEEGKAFVEQQQRSLSWRPERPGIPMHKLCDNSGWHVTRDECQEALAAIKAWLDRREQLTEQELAAQDAGWVLEELEDTVEFLESGAQHDGFTVD
jgi:hypothetical protein